LNWKIIRFKYTKYNIKNKNFPNNYENVENFDIKIFENIINRLNYSGGLCVDFKFDRCSNKLYIFEMNPRFGGVCVYM
jgi:carbamoylphosphate synthase large subunit